MDVIFAAWLADQYFLPAQFYHLMEIVSYEYLYIPFYVFKTTTETSYGGCVLALEGADSGCHSLQGKLAGQKKGPALQRVLLQQVRARDSLRHEHRPRTRAV